MGVRKSQVASHSFFYAKGHTNHFPSSAVKNVTPSPPPKLDHFGELRFNILRLPILAHIAFRIVKTFGVHSNCPKVLSLIMIIEPILNPFLSRRSKLMMSVH